jgi:hypothetical protein
MAFVDAFTITFGAPIRMFLLSGPEPCPNMSLGGVGRSWPRYGLRA